MRDAIGTAILLCLLAGCEFNGVINGSIGPPDPHIAVGATHIVHVYNFAVRVWPRDFSREDTFPLAQMVGCGLPVQLGESPFDPRVHYDASVPGGRWYYVAALKPTGGQPGKWCIGITPTGDPAQGPFAFYQIPSPNTAFPDQPQLGFSADKIIISQVDFPSELGALLVLNKAAALSGQALSAFIFPEDPFSSIAVSALYGTGIYAYTVGDKGNRLRVWRIDGIPGVSTVTKIADSVGIAPLSFQRYVEQPGTTVRLDIRGLRVHDAVYAFPSMWVAAHTSCRTLPDTVDRNCVRFFELRGLHSSPFSLTAEQVITHGEAGLHFFYPAIQVDQAGNLLAVFDSVGANRFPSIFVGGQLATDPKTSFRGPYVLKAGTTSYTQGELFQPGSNSMRYGDYSGAALDPTDRNFAWVTSEYPNNSSRWNTYIATIGASCDPVRRCCGGGCN